MMVGYDVIRETGIFQESIKYMYMYMQMPCGS